jgi:hypothetical protein
MVRQACPEFIEGIIAKVILRRSTLEFRFLSLLDEQVECAPTYPPRFTRLSAFMTPAIL